jgi:hypothetical protein
MKTLKKYLKDLSGQKKNPQAGDGPRACGW